MKIHGDDARLYKVIRLDSCEDAHKGELIVADEADGTFSYKDTPESTKQVTLGPHTIRVVRK